MDILQGTLDMLILRALEPGAMHGIGVAQRIHQVTRGAFEVKPGSLFPAWGKNYTRKIPDGRKDSAWGCSLSFNAC